jgi:hypothetical protein
MLFSFSCPCGQACDETSACVDGKHLLKLYVTDDQKNSRVDFFDESKELKQAGLL